MGSTANELSVLAVTMAMSSETHRGCGWVVKRGVCNFLFVCLLFHVTDTQTRAVCVQYVCAGLLRQ